MSRETCLKRHLLFASVQAYHPRPPLYSAAPRWTQGPVELAAPPIDFALVGRFAEGIVVAFRGTLPPLDLSPDGREIIGGFPGLDVIRDWLNNFNAPLARNFAVGGHAVLPGGVHRGFAGSLARLWDDVADAVVRLRGADEAPHLYFTGHSKGGALANLAAVCARQVWPDATVKAATFGAARAGNADFARAYRAARIDCHRYEVELDVVPDVPPGSVPVGAPHDVAEIHYRPSLGDERWLLRGPIGAHLPYRGFGYGEHVCEAGCGHDWR